MSVKTEVSRSQLEYYRFMGFSSEELRRRYAVYAARFPAGARVLDLGCGRGEFLELLKERGAQGTGIDIDQEMAGEVARKGLAVVCGDAREFLLAHPETYDGIFAAHLAEHLPAPELEDLVGACAQALRPQGRLILVTPNPGNLRMHQGEFWIDLQHVRFYSPLILRYLLHSAGLRQVEIGYGDTFTLGPEVALPALPGSPSVGWRSPVRRARRAAERALLGGRVADLEQRVAQLTRWAASLYGPAEYFVTAVR
jgi:SAM-dependent methyltransferase